MKKTMTALLVLMMAGCSASNDRYYAIDHFYISEEGEAFKEIFNKLTVDTYNWYRSIEGEDGVYILHSDHFTQDILEEWRTYQAYETIPEEEFWYFAVSENYLEDIGFEVTEEQKKMIHDGIRLYLLPDAMTDEQEETMRKFLQEEAEYGMDIPPMIPTVFHENRETAFMTYSFDGGLDSVTEGEISSPVIFLASCENMKYFESESLIATGKTDSYIKLTKEAYDKYVKASFPEELKNRNVTFLPISKINN